MPVLLQLILICENLECRQNPDLNTLISSPTPCWSGFKQPYSREKLKSASIPGCFYSPSFFPAFLQGWKWACTLVGLLSVQSRALWKREFSGSGLSAFPVLLLTSVGCEGLGSMAWGFSCVSAATRSGQKLSHGSDCARDAAASLSLTLEAEANLLHQSMDRLVLWTRSFCASLSQSSSSSPCEWQLLCNFPVGPVRKKDWMWWDLVPQNSGVQLIASFWSSLDHGDVNRFLFLLVAFIRCAQSVCKEVLQYSWRLRRKEES